MISLAIFDFDGTCTQIPAAYAEYLERYRIGLARLISSFGKDELVHKDRASSLISNIEEDGGNESSDALASSDWAEALDEVRQSSPNAGWTLAGCPAAPAAADPYILAYEAAQLLLRRRGKENAPLPASIHHHAYERFPAPWRKEASQVFTRLLKSGVGIAIVSNSSSSYIERRLDDLFSDEPELRVQIAVYSDAGKFRICELPWDNSRPISNNARAVFDRLPAAENRLAPGRPTRPVYLRRGQYFESILCAMHDNLELLSRTIVCGDIWEMDLAMPAALGARVHLVERAAPFSAYSYERQAISDCGELGKTSADLSGLLSWLPSL